MEPKKILFKAEVRCPHCHKYIDVAKVRKVIKLAVMGKYEDLVVVKKAVQKKLRAFARRK